MVTASGNVAPLLRRAFLFLEDRDWDSADEYCEKVLDLDPECAEAYLGKLMAEMKIDRREALGDAAKPFDGSNHYQKAIRFGDAKLKAELTGYIEHINTRNEIARLDGIYAQAKQAMDNARTEAAYREAANRFASIPMHRDAAAQAEKCRKLAEITRKDSIYADAQSKMNRGVIFYVEAAEKAFAYISGWKDADEQRQCCLEKIKKMKAEEEDARKKAEGAARRKRLLAAVAAVAAVLLLVVYVAVIRPMMQYNDAVALMEAGKYTEAITAFEAMEGYEDSVQKIEDCRIALKDIAYGEAITLMESGKTGEAYEAFAVLGNYKDSSQKAGSLIKPYMAAKINAAKVGSLIIFGSYKQGNNTSNGAEVIEWRVLAKEGNRALLISEYALEARPYNTNYTDVTWETCTLRSWLNGEFFDNAFTSEEQAVISTTTVKAHKNPNYSTPPGNDTQDKVFLLSIQEVNQYFSTDEARKCVPTAYAKAQGAYTSSSYTVGGKATCWWWLRSPSSDQDDAAYVGSDGGVREGGCNMNRDYVCARPALWIDLES